MYVKSRELTIIKTLKPSVIFLLSILDAYGFTNFFKFFPYLIISSILIFLLYHSNYRKILFFNENDVRQPIHMPTYTLVQTNRVSWCIMSFYFLFCAKYLWLRISMSLSLLVWSNVWRVTFICLCKSTSVLLYVNPVSY